MPRGLSKLDLELWRSVVKLYMGDPLTHVYLLYDLIYELDRTDAFFEVAGSDIIGYLLVWRGPLSVACHLWGRAKGLIDNIPYHGESIIVVHERRLLEPVTSFLKPKGQLKVKEHFDMTVNEDDFKPFSAERAVKLDARDKRHVEGFLKLSRVSGWEMDEKKAKKTLERRRYYGLFDEGRLVSIACAFFRMPEVWPIGSVYTHPDYRGKGYAKIVTSAITKDALLSGARALLHVAEDNTPAIRVYKALGYKTISKKPWIFFNP